MWRRAAWIVLVCMVSAAYGLECPRTWGSTVNASPQKTKAACMHCASRPISDASINKHRTFGFFRGSDDVCAIGIARQAEGQPRPKCIRLGINDRSSIVVRTKAETGVIVVRRPTNIFRSLFGNKISQEGVSQMPNHPRCGFFTLIFKQHRNIQAAVFRDLSVDDHLLWGDPSSLRALRRTSGVRNDYPSHDNQSPGASSQPELCLSQGLAKVAGIALTVLVGVEFPS